MSVHCHPARVRAGIVAAAVTLLLMTPIAATAGSLIASDPPEIPVGATVNPLSLAKFVDPLPVPGPMPMAGTNYYEIGMWQVMQQFHSSLPATPVWGYGPTAASASYPAATIEAVRGVPIQVRWTNNLPATHLLEDAIDHTLHMAHPMSGVPAVVHLHGGETEPPSDGHPDAWFTQGFAEKGPGWVKETFTYYNAQPPATLWYHDHALGITRLNVYAGLAGFYLLRDPGHEPAWLPSGPYEIPIAIQDRMLTPEGALYYPNVGDNPEHPVWTPEFFGNIIVVNGKAWPYLEVERRTYRLRLLNGSNARFYSLKIENTTGNRPGPWFVQIGTDGGYLPNPVVLAGSRTRLIIGPGERADVLVDFSRFPVGTRLLMTNTATEPFPDGDDADPATTGQIMQFRVTECTNDGDAALTSFMNTAESGEPVLEPLGHLPKLGPPDVIRTLTLNELMGANGPLAALLNGRAWDSPVSEMPVLGTTEQWEIVNMTGDAHPIHLHGVQFQLVSRQAYDVAAYEAVWMAANPEVPSEDPVSVPISLYLMGGPRQPDRNERGWKDTFRMNQGEVTRVIIKFAPIDGSPNYPFDATAEPGYVWHCHILEHEDNEMMRPYRMVAPALVEKPMAEATPSASAPGARLLASTDPLEVRLALDQSGLVVAEVYDVMGQRVTTLVRGVHGAGEHAWRWDGRNHGGTSVTSGVYFLRVVTPWAVISRKATIMR